MTTLLQLGVSMIVIIKIISIIAFSMIINKYREHAETCPGLRHKMIEMNTP